MTYAIIKVAGKQYRVREGERLLVDRLAEEDGATFTPTVLLVGGGDDDPVLDPDLKVTAKIIGGVKGPKIRIGKYKKRTGYRRHTGFRASLTQIEIESIGAKRAAAKKQEPAAEKPPAAEKQEPVAEKAKAEPKAAPKAAPAAEPEPQEPERVKGMPVDYEHLTVAALKEASTHWNRPMLEAALEYEKQNANRKGAIAALESALAAKEDDS